MSRYKVNRIGFVNFWLYDEEDFYFYDGKLLLRGTNGSGKTVTMQSFFPLIFDGNKSPERLDPFGSRDRKIEDYLLPEGFQGNENTGYLYMEFFNQDDNKYLTIGIGLRAIRNRNCEFWGFALTDNRRIGTDFLLFRERNLRIPLTKKELQTRIGTGGEFVETIKDYKKMVNRLLFGFSNDSLYSEFINLLIQVRSPKLSNSTRPSQLTKILSTVLEPLSEDDLRVMADSIEDMNKYKEKIDDLQNEQKACNSLKSIYQEYNKSVLYDKGQAFLKYRQDKNGIQKSIKEKQLELENLLNENEIEKENIKNLKLEEQELEHRKSKLDETDLKSITNQLEEINSMIKELEQEKITKDSEMEQKESNLLENKNNLKVKQDELYNVETAFNDLIQDLTSYEDDIAFDDAKFYLDDLKKQKLEFKQMSSYLETMKKRVRLLNKLNEISYRIYQKAEEIEIEKNKYVEKEDYLNERNKERASISEQLLIYLDEYKSILAKASEDNRKLKIDPAKLNEIYQVIDNLEQDMLLKIKDILKEQAYKIKDEICIDISNNNIKINEYEDKIAKLKQDLDLVATALTKNLDDDNTKDYFIKNDIQYEYLFNTIDFKDNVDDNKKRYIESFLYKTGILTSFVIDKDIKNVDISSKCLNEGAFVPNNLTSYLEPLSTPFKDKVLNILKSISIDSNDIVSIQDNGKYKLAIIEGTSDINHDLRYIGSTVRQDYILREQEKINIQINLLNKAIDDLKDSNLNLKNDINLLNEELNNFKFPTEINDYFVNINKLDLDIEFINDNLTALAAVIKVKTSELRDIEQEFSDNKQGYYGSVNYKELDELLKNTNVYFELVQNLNTVYKDYLSKYEFVSLYNVNIETIQDDLDNFKYELDQINFKLDNYNRKKQTIDDILNSDKYKDVGKEYKHITERLTVIKDILPVKNDIVITNKVNSEHLEKDIQNLKIELENSEVLKNVAYKIFMDEYKLHYISDLELEENELYHFITSLKINISNREILEKFNDSLNKYAPILINYAPKSINIHLINGNEYLNFTNNENHQKIITDMLESAIRKDITFNYSGKNVNLLELTELINSSISNYENLINAENRCLFEDLLINNIGSSIREKINQSQEWIDKVKELMESMNTSSGLSFSLKWAGIQGQTEDEIDTKEIVEIFRKDADSLKQKYLDKMTNHFKSKIKMKEESLEESERNYLEIIKEVLDYRKWFEFKLYFKRGNGEKRELTDREFNKMSGGEKAIAMYVPLFSSIYAKLSSGYSYAPRIIALDEAFAGVDDDNIKDVFRILEEFDIDYVLTSQQLWGDYETVKHLAISELHHPIGSNVVSVIKYKWDGISRIKVDSNSEYGN